MPSTIDISKWDGYDIYGNPVTFNFKAAGFPLAIIKSSQGTYKDPMFEANWIANRGIPRMAYHYFLANVNAIAQAEYMKSILAFDFNKDTDYMACDFEETRGVDGYTALKAAMSFLYELEKVNLPFIYTGPSSWFELGQDSATMQLKTAAKKYKLWQAQWLWDNYFLNIKLPPYVWTAAKMSEKQALIDSGAVRPVPVYPWNGDVAIWQWTAKANPALIPGYLSEKDAVDYNKIYMPLPSVGTPPPPPVLTDHERIDRLEARALSHGWDL